MEISSALVETSSLTVQAYIEIESHITLGTLHTCMKMRQMLSLFMM